MIEKEDYGAVPDNHLFRRRSSVEVYNTFLDEFKVAKGSRLIVLFGFLTSLGIGSLVSVIPQVTTQRFAEDIFGLEEGINCNDFEEDKPQECVQGADYAQAAASYSVLVANLLALMTNSLAGSYSDLHGRKGELQFVIVDAPLRRGIQLTTTCLLRQESKFYLFSCCLALQSLSWPFRFARTFIPFGSTSLNTPLV